MPNLSPLHSVALRIDEAVGSVKVAKQEASLCFDQPECRSVNAQGVGSKQLNEKTRRRTEIIRASADASGLWMKVMHMCFHGAALTEPF